MNRRYSRSFYLELAESLKSELPDFSLTLDVMAGFPGEGQSHFQNTVDLLQRIKPLKCHVFPYSRREGTRAAALEDLPAPVIRDRVRQLIALASQLSREVRQQYVGRTFPVLVEKQVGTGKLLQGITPNYLSVCFQGEREWVGENVSVKLLTLQGDTFLGSPKEVNHGCIV
jgi:threonylcarbamoyladenosine tRNA methylthiotransferase MtaB